jgi:hypothetical protein
LIRAEKLVRLEVGVVNIVYCVLQYLLLPSVCASTMYWSTGALLRSTVVFGKLLGAGAAGAFARGAGLQVFVALVHVLYRISLSENL